MLGKASSDFLRCKEGFDKYDVEVNRLATSVKEAEAAKEQGRSEIAIQKIAEANEGLKAAEASAEKLAKQVTEIKDKGKRGDGGREDKGAASDCCRIAPNAELKSLGRIVVAFPKGSKAGGTRIDIFRTEDDKKLITYDHGRIAADLVPGGYVVAVTNERVKGVEVRAGHDTKIRVGVLRVHAGPGTRVDIFERGAKDLLTYFHGSHDTGLPIGQYDVEVAGQRAPVTIKEDAITEF